MKCGAESGKSKVETALVKAVRRTEPTSGSQNYSPFHTGGENLAVEINPKRQEGEESGPGCLPESIHPQQF